MVIAAAGDDKPHAPRFCGQGGDIGGGMPGIKHLDPREPEGTEPAREQPESPRQEILLGMCEHGHPAELGDEPDGGERGYAFGGDIRRALLSEITVERLLHRRDFPLRDHGGGDVFSPDSPCLKIHLGCHAERREPLAYRNVTQPPLFLDGLEFLHE